jgi:hypothetical protein
MINVKTVLDTVKKVPRCFDHRIVVWELGTPFSLEVEGVFLGLGHRGNVGYGGTMGMPSGRLVPFGDGGTHESGHLRHRRYLLEIFPNMFSVCGVLRREVIALLLSAVDLASRTRAWSSRRMTLAKPTETELF